MDKEKSKYYITQDGEATYIYEQPAELNIELSEAQYSLLMKMAEAAGETPGEILRKALTEYGEEKLKEMLNPH